MLYLRNLLIAALVLPFQYVIVPILLLTRWNGRTTWFGNEKWGRGHGHFEHHTETYWEEFVWLTYRNPINNLMNRFGATYMWPISIPYGNPQIGDKVAGGWYFARMGKFWELYVIIPYPGKKHCVRIRLGWKIVGKKPGELCPMVVAIRPIQNYYGA